MQRGQMAATRLHVTRRSDLSVRCTYGTMTERLANRYASCGASIPYGSKTCPACGESQAAAHAEAPPADDPRILDGSVALVDSETGEVVAVQMVCATALANRLAQQFRTVKWSTPITSRKKPANEARLSGIIVTHAVFGWTKPQILRGRWSARRADLDRKMPDVRAALGEFCTTAEHVFRTLAPEVYDETGQAVRDAIPGAFLIEGTPWTSGIINHTASLPYHRDRNNVRGSWSAMLGARHNVGGGLLHLADYDVWLTIPNGSITIFDGQSVTHGVTPLVPTGSNAYRYTVVTYALQALRNCLPDPAEEAHRAALHATRNADRNRAR